MAGAEGGGVTMATHRTWQDKDGTTYIVEHDGREARLRFRRKDGAIVVTLPNGETWRMASAYLDGTSDNVVTFVPEGRD